MLLITFQTYPQGQSLHGPPCSSSVSGLQGYHCYTCLGDHLDEANAKIFFDQEDHVLFILKEAVDLIQGNNIF